MQKCYTSGPYRWPLSGQSLTSVPHQVFHCMFFDRRVPFDGEETASPWVTHLVTVYTLKTDHGNVYIWISTVLDSKDSNAFFLRVFGLLFAGMIHPWIINNPTLTTFRLSYFQSVSMQTLDAICTLSNYFQMNVRVFRILDFSKVTFGSSHVGVTMWWWWEGMSRCTSHLVGRDVKMQAARQETARWQQPLQALISPELLPPLTCLKLTFFPLYQALWFVRSQAIGFNPLGKLCPPTWPSVA